MIWKWNGEIDEKHALQNYQNECGPGYRVVELILKAVELSLKAFVNFHIFFLFLVSDRCFEAAYKKMASLRIDLFFSSAMKIVPIYFKSQKMPIFWASKT